MNKTKLSVILDSILIAFSITLLSYLLINKYLKNAIFSLFICIIIYISVFFVIFKHFNNKHSLSKIKLFEQKDAALYLKFLTYTSEDFDIKFYSNLLNANYINNNIYENNEVYFYINLKTKLNDKDFKFINEFFTKNDNKPFIIIKNNCFDEFITLLKNSPNKLILIDYIQLYNLMKTKNYFPTKLEKQEHFFKFKNFKLKSKQSLNSKNFFKFFLSGTSLIILSLFIPFIKYYMFFGSALLIISIICLFNKNKSVDNHFDLTSVIKKTDTK